MNTRAADRLALALLLLLPALLLWPSLVGRETFVAYDLAGHPPLRQQLDERQLATLRAAPNHDATEIPIWLLPETRLAKQELAAGRWPGWNPWARQGTSMHGTSVLGLCYPPNWLLLLGDDPQDRLGWLCWLSLAITGWLMFGCLRAHGFGTAAALLGAATWQLSHPLAVNLHFYPRLGSMIWLPGGIWAVAALARGGRRPFGAVAGLAVCLGLPWTTGFPPYATVGTLLLGGYGLFCCGGAWRSVGPNGGHRAALRLAGWLLFGAALGFGLSAPQLLPTVLFFPESARPLEPTLRSLCASRYDPCGLLGWVLPDLFGSPGLTEHLPYRFSPLAWWLWSSRDIADLPLPPDNYNYTEYTIYAGVLPLLLAIAGAVAGRRRAFPVLALLAMLALALYLPVARELFRLPVWNSVWPHRWLALGALPLAWLAAAGLEVVAQRRRWCAGLAITALVAALLCAAAAARLGEPATATAALLDDVAAHYRTLDPAIDSARARAHIDPDGTRIPFALAHGAAACRAALWTFLFATLWFAVAWWRHGSPRHMPWALLAATLLTAGDLLPRARTVASGRELIRVPHPIADWLAAQRAADHNGGFTIARASRTPVSPAQLPPGALLPAHVRDLHFYDHYDARSHRPLEALFGSEVVTEGLLRKSLPDDERLQSPLLDLLGVRYLLSTEPLQHGGTRVAAAITGPRFHIHERPRWLPRAFMVDELRTLPDDAAVIAALIAPEFAPRQVAYTTSTGSGAGQIGSGAAAREVRMVQDVPDEVVLQIAAGPAGHVVLCDTWLPGWQAEVDQTATPILRVNLSLRAVAVPDRACTVRFRYRVPGLGAGLWLGSCCWLLVLAGAASRLASRRDEMPS